MVNVGASELFDTSSFVQASVSAARTPEQRLEDFLKFYTAKATNWLRHMLDKADDDCSDAIAIVRTAFLEALTTLLNYNEWPSDKKHIAIALSDEDNQQAFIRIINNRIRGSAENFTNLCIRAGVLATENPVTTVKHHPLAIELVESAMTTDIAN